MMILTRKPTFPLLILLLLLLTACGSQNNTAQTDDPVLTGENILNARIVAADGEDLILAGLSDPYEDVYLLSAAALPDTIDPKPGTTVLLAFDGALEGEAPVRVGTVTAAETVDRDGLVRLYLDVLEDLWQKDPALHDGISMAGFDLSSTRLTPGEQKALAFVFAREHGGLETVSGTWQELAEQGYIDGENLFWPDGVLLSITETGDGEETGEVVFDAEIWRSGLGAYCFYDCTGKPDSSGAWSYTVGGEAIS